MLSTVASLFSQPPEIAGVAKWRLGAERAAVITDALLSVNNGRRGCGKCKARYRAYGMFGDTISKFEAPASTIFGG